MSRAALLLSVALSSVACNRGPATTTADRADAATPVVVVENPGTPPEKTPEAEQPPPAEQDVPGRTEIVPTDVDCVQDSDCVKATCCHATTCVAASARPDCSTAACTADCRAGTMDCNGGCLCQAGKCAAKLWWAPAE